MIIDFRQGIITYPTNGTQQSFIVKTGNSFTLSTSNGRVDIAFAHGTENYLLTEASTVNNAWSNVPAGVDCWLYWDIDLRTAVRTFGFSTTAPTAATTYTAAPTANAHWFDLTTHKMKVFVSGNFREVIRVFAAKVRDNTITPLGSGYSTKLFAGSQVGIQSPATTVGRIMVDDAGLPLRRADGRFFTTENEFFVDGSPVNTVRIESDVLSATAVETMARYQVVKLSHFGQVSLAAYSDIEDTAIAMLMEDLNVGETGTICLQGHITNPEWNWQNAGAALWVTGAGLLTETNPHVANALNHPTDKVPVARVITRHSIYFSQGLGAKGEKGESGSGTGGGGTGELAPIMFPNLIADDRISPPTGVPGTRGYHAYVGNDVSHPIYPNGLTHFPAGETYRLRISIDANTTIEVAVQSGNCPTFQALADQITTYMNSISPDTIVAEFVTGEVPGVDDGGTMRFYSTTYGADSYMNIDEDIDTYDSTRPLSIALTMYTQTTQPIILESAGSATMVNGYYITTDVPHQHGTDGFDTLPYVDEYYVVAPQGTTTGLWSTFTNWELLVYDKTGAWKSLGDARTLLLNKRVGVAMTAQSYTDHGRAPSGTMTGKRGSVATYDGSGWSFVDPTIGDVLTVVESTVVDPYNKRKRLRFDTTASGSGWLDTGDGVALVELNRTGSPEDNDLMSPIWTLKAVGTAPLSYRVEQPSWDRSGHASLPSIDAKDITTMGWSLAHENLSGFTPGVVAQTLNSYLGVSLKSNGVIASTVDVLDPQFAPIFQTVRPASNSVGLHCHAKSVTSSTVSASDAFMYVAFPSGSSSGVVMLNPHVSQQTPIFGDNQDGSVLLITNRQEGTPAWASINLPLQDTFTGTAARTKTRYIPRLGGANHTGLDNTHVYEISVHTTSGATTTSAILAVGQGHGDDVTTFAGLVTALNDRLSLTYMGAAYPVRCCLAFGSIAFVGAVLGYGNAISVSSPPATTDLDLLDELNTQFGSQYLPIAPTAVAGIGGVSGHVNSDTAGGMFGFVWNVPLVPTSRTN